MHIITYIKYCMKIYGVKWRECLGDVGFRYRKHATRATYEFPADDTYDFTNAFIRFRCEQLVKDGDPNAVHMPNMTVMT